MSSSLKAGEAVPLGELSHESRIGGGLGPPEAVVEMGHRETLEFGQPEEVEQNNGITATGNSNEGRGRGWNVCHRGQKTP